MTSRREWHSTLGFCQWKVPRPLRRLVPFVRPVGEGVLVGCFSEGVPAPREGDLMTKGYSEELELASAAAARMLTRTTSAGGTGTFGCWIQTRRS